MTKLILTLCLVTALLSTVNATLNTYLTCAEDRNLTWALGDNALHLHPSNVTFAMSINPSYRPFYTSTTCSDLISGFGTNIQLATFSGESNIEILKNLALEGVSFYALLGLNQKVFSVEPDEGFYWGLDFNQPMTVEEYASLWSDREPDDYSNGQSGAGYGCFSSGRPDGIQDCLGSETGLIPMCSIPCMTTVCTLSCD
jgi:hypothetical protein